LKPVNQYNLEGALINKYKSATEAGKSLGIGSNLIRGAANKKNKLASGYYWRYGTAHAHINVAMFQAKRIHHFNLKPKPVQRLGADGMPMETYVSATAAADSAGTETAGIISSCNSTYRLCKGYRWQFVETNTPN